MSSLEKLEEIIKDLELGKRDAEKADQGNFSAGVRLRKDALKGKKALDELRQLIIEKREKE